MIGEPEFRRETERRTGSPEKSEPGRTGREHNRIRWERTDRSQNRFV